MMLSPILSRVLLAAAAAVALALALAAGFMLRGCGERPLVDELDLADVAEAGRTVELDAGREPTAIDTAAVSGSGGTAPAVRIEYRDRWRDVEAPTCPDGTPPEEAPDVRTVAVPIEAPPLASLSSRPVSVTPDRVVLTYQRAEGASAGQTVQEVWTVPDRTFGYSLSAAIVASNDSLDWHPAGLRLSPAVLASVRYRRAVLGLAVPIASDPRRVRATLTYRLAGRP